MRCGYKRGPSLPSFGGRHPAEGNEGRRGTVGGTASLASLPAVFSLAGGERSASHFCVCVCCELRGVAFIITLLRAHLHTQSVSTVHKCRRG